MRHNPFLADIMERKINWLKGKGTPRKTFMGEIIETTGCNGNSYMKILALNREEEKLIFLPWQGLAFRRRLFFWTSSEKFSNIF